MKIKFLRTKILLDGADFPHLWPLEINAFGWLVIVVKNKFIIVNSLVIMIGLCVIFIINWEKIYIVHWWGRGKHLY
jgi:hypothetical protein